jgi:hypothetical protein
MNKEHISSLLAGRGMERQMKDLGPALKGSLAKVYKPCIRKKCALCERGDKHPAWILTVSQQGRRRCLYVPEELVPTIQRAIQNGRKLEEWLCNAGPEIIQAFRRKRDNAKKKKQTTAKC